MNDRNIKPDKPLSLAFRIVCMTIGMATLITGYFMNDIGCAAAGSGLFAWTLGYLWGEATAYYDAIMKPAGEVTR